MRILRPILDSIRGQKPVTFTAPLAPEAGFFVVGDIHGCDELLGRLLAKITAMVECNTCPIVFVGDYIDRGEDSAAVLRRLHHLDKTSRRSIVCLMGNHEAMLLRFLEDPAAAGPQWLRHGGLQTLASFRIEGVSEKLNTKKYDQIRDALVVEMGADLVTWLRTLPSQWRCGNVSVVHAGADPDTPLKDQPHDTLIWGHPSFQTKCRADGQWVVHGHTIAPEVTAQNGRLSIDTGAYATGQLSGVFVSASGFEPLGVSTDHGTNP